METAVSSPSADGPLMFKSRSARARPSARKRAATPPSGGSSSESSEADEEEDEISTKQPAKRRKVLSGVRSKMSEGDGTSRTSQGSGTVIEEIRPLPPSDELNEAALLGTRRPLPETVKQTSQDPTPSEPKGPYRFPTQQQSFIPKNPDAPPSKFGPQKAAPSSIRTVTFTDYAPDVCKDYKQTGFCGFGDSCKFLHAREDYKAGWALDRDWEVKTKDGKAVKGTVVASATRASEGSDVAAGDEDKELEKIPFACIICKGPYKNPIITKCGHYFCEGCALKRYQKSPNCEACGTGTNGVFNGAKNLKRLLERKAEREKRKTEEAEAEAAEKT